MSERKTPPKWTGDLVGKMHNARITMRSVAEEMGVTRAYLTMIMKGRRTPPNARKRVTAAFEAVLARKQAESDE